MRLVAGLGAAVAALFALLAMPASLAAQSVEDFYKQKKQIALIVGSAANTSYDGWARLVARHMGKHIPGSPSILVKNMPGASGITSANHIYNSAPKDGSTFGTFSRNIPGQALMGDAERIKYDPRLFGWIGSPELPVGVCAVRTDTGVKTAADVMTKEVLMGGSGAGSGPSFMPAVINNVTGSKFKVIEGYQGSSEIHLAIVRGEVSGICGGYYTIRRQQGERLTSGAMAVLFSYERKRHEILGGVPSVTEFITDPTKRQLFAFITSSSEFGRPYAAPPDLPADRLTALRRAFAALAGDGEFLAEVEKLDLPFNLTTGEELQTVAKELFEIPKETRDQAIAMMPKGGLSD